MGRTNIRSGSEFLLRAGYDFEDLAVIPDFGNLPVQIVSASLPQEELDEHSLLFHHRRSNAWVRRTEPTPSGFEDAAADQRFRTPNIQVSRGLENFHETRYGTRKPHIEGDMPELAYLLVVQGQSGATQSKLVIKWSLNAVATAPMTEVVNGFSVAFSGAVLKADVKKFGDRAYKFVKVDGLASMVEMATKGEKVIPVLC